MEQWNNLKELINQGNTDQAIEQLDQLLGEGSNTGGKDTLYYLRGNAYRKKGDWQQALTTINPLLISILKAPLYKRARC